MIYECTKDMLKALKVEAGVKPDVYSGLFGWNVKVGTYGRRKLVYLMNNESKVSVVLFGMTAKEFKVFDKIVMESLEVVLGDMGIDKETIRAYLEDGKECFVGASGTRKQMGNLNRAYREAEWFFDDYMEGGLLQRHLCHHQNNGIVKNDQGDYVCPGEYMKLALSRIYGKHVNYDLEEIGIYMFMDDRLDQVPFLNVKDGSIAVAERDSEEAYELEDDEDYVIIRSERYDFFREFYRFAETIENADFHEEIERYGHGSGAIRRIRDIIDRYPEIRIKWFAFRDDLEQGIVARWLESMGLR